MDDHSTALEHIVNTGKVMAGGAGVGGATYVSVAKTAPLFDVDLATATAIAGFVAAAMTAVYFAVSAGYAIWKWRKEANGK